MVASSQPLATQAGIEIIRKGGNAIDAAVATAAVLDVVEPFSTGCGGDAFTLIHLPGSTKPLSYNGSGKSGSLVSLQDLLDKGWTEMPERGGPPVTVPGALHLWSTVVERHGALELAEVLKPAIHYARNGFPVSPLIGRSWPTKKHEEYTQLMGKPRMWVRRCGTRTLRMSSSLSDTREATHSIQGRLPSQSLTLFRNIMGSLQWRT